MHGFDEIELTNKGRRALEDQHVEIHASFPSYIKTSPAFLMILAMTRAGLSVSDMTRDFAESSGMDIQSADSLIESLVQYLEATGYVKWIPCEEEEPPEAFSGFKDHF
jgi:hypothetical protein